MKSKLTTYLLLLLTGFTACEKPANIDLPSSEPKPVVFAFLSPEEKEIKVSVTLSNPIFTNKPQEYNFKVVTNALVQLEDESGSKIALTYNQIFEVYIGSQTQMKILPGKKYKVIVSFDKYAVYGETTIPLTTIPIKDVELNLTGTDAFGNKNYVIYTRWQDPPNESNYYRVLLESKTISFNNDTVYSGFFDKIVAEPSNDGKELFTRKEMSFYSQFGEPYYYMDAYLVHTDYNYYECHNRRLNYVDGDIFVEPMPLYSNIKGGGIGVIGSYRKYRQHVAIPK